MPTRPASGITVIVTLAVVMVLGVIAAAGYLVLAGGQDRAATQTRAADERRKAEAKEAAEQAKQSETIARTDKEQIEGAHRTYCRTEYKRVWEGAYGKTIDPNSVTATYDDSVKNPFVIKGNRALIRAAKCDTTELSDLQKFAPFMLYFKQTADQWQAYERYQSTPPCADFDGGEWPAEVLPECRDNEQTRAPKQ